MYTPANKKGWPWNQKLESLPSVQPDGSLWPRITIVTPSYNQAPYIVETIRSVLLQGYPNLEYIVIDGGSKDDSIDIIRKYENQLSYWVSEPDRGQSHAINKGLAHATGEIIAWINSDDWYEPEAFFTVAEFFLQHPEEAIIIGNCQLVDAQGIAFMTVVNKEMSRNELLKFWVPYAIPTQPAIFFRKKLLDESGLLDESLYFAMDYDLWMRFTAHNSFRHIDKILANYRFHSEAKGSDQDWSKFVPEWTRVFKRYAGANIWIWMQYYFAEILSGIKRIIKSLRSIINYSGGSHA